MAFRISVGLKHKFVCGPALKRAAIGVMQIRFLKYNKL